MVDQASRVHLKTVQVGRTTDTSTNILSGISEGDRVVVDGTDRLVEGAVVRVRKAGELDDAAAADAKGGAGSRGRGGARRGDTSASAPRGNPAP